MIKYKHGLILGKFYPFHKGHQYLIDSAIEQCTFVTVLVCSLKNETIPGQLRYEWIKEHYAGNGFVKIKHVQDEVQQYPNGDTDSDFWDIWTGIIMREMGTKAYDVIFTSEEYGKQLSQRTNFKYPNMKMDYVDVDTARTTFPVSGTLVRENPLKQWEYLPDVVKPYFMKKIVFVGPESVGKTYTCEIMDEYFNTMYVPEYGREYTDMLKRVGREMNEDDFTKIAEGHIADAKRIANNNIKSTRNDKLLLLDTDAMITEIWGEIYCRKTLDDVVALEKEYIQKGDLYILLRPDIPWVNDGTRDFPHLRTWHYNRILNELKKRNLNYVIVSGSFENRISTIKNIITLFMEKAEKSNFNMQFRMSSLDGRILNLE